MSCHPDRTCIVSKGLSEAATSEIITLCVRASLYLNVSGPSQEFGWVGHGTLAPLGIPNIFKVAGIDTTWDPQSNKIFEAGKRKIA